MTDDVENEENYKNKKALIISSRVHPGESNASYILKGQLDFLLSKNAVAESLRSKFVFKILPMLNPDGKNIKISINIIINIILKYFLGVRYGNYRCCILGNDFNRKWKTPSPVFHAPIYFAKKVIEKA